MTITSYSAPPGARASARRGSRRPIGLRVTTREGDAARLIAVVVFPTPPFWLATVRIRANAGPPFTGNTTVSCTTAWRGAKGEMPGAPDASSNQVLRFTNQDTRPRGSPAPPSRGGGGTVHDGPSPRGSSPDRPPARPVPP